jgi:hypothetical protein
MPLRFLRLWGLQAVMSEYRCMLQPSAGAASAPDAVQKWMVSARRSVPQWKESVAGMDGEGMRNYARSTCAHRAALT